jgi:hypothetical protein
MHEIKNKKQRKEGRMAKEENGNFKFNVANGFQFGFGFFLANLAGFAIIGVIAWIIILVARATGLVF